MHFFYKTNKIQQKIYYSIHLIIYEYIKILITSIWNVTRLSLTAHRFIVIDKIKTIWPCILENYAQETAQFTYTRAHESLTQIAISARSAEKRTNHTIG